jgi:hypothetical protein
MLDTGIIGGNEVQMDVLYIAGAQISGVRSLLQLNFAQRCLTFVGPQYGICFMPSFWCLEFFGGAHNLENLCPPAEQETMEVVKWSAMCSI